MTSRHFLLVLPVLVLLGWSLLGAMTTRQPEPNVVIIPVPQMVERVTVDEAVAVPAEAWQWHRMIATAYTDGPESTGKKPGHPAYGITRSGLPTRPGVVAVDPDVIPLGSIVYVEGYGIAVALDTRSAIKGQREDVRFEALDDALAWGRRAVWVGVLTAHDDA